MLPSATRSRRSALNCTLRLSRETQPRRRSGSIAVAGFRQLGSNAASRADLGESDACAPPTRSDPGQRSLKRQELGGVLPRTKSGARCDGKQEAGLEGDQLRGWSVGRLGHTKAAGRSMEGFAPHFTASSGRPGFLLDGGAELGHRHGRRHRRYEAPGSPHRCGGVGSGDPRTSSRSCTRADAVVS